MKAINHQSTITTIKRLQCDPAAVASFHVTVAISRLKSLAISTAIDVIEDY